MLSLYARSPTKGDAKTTVIKPTRQPADSIKRTTEPKVIIFKPTKITTPDKEKKAAIRPRVLEVNPLNDTHAYLQELISIKFSTKMDLQSLIDATTFVGMAAVIAKEIDVYIFPDPDPYPDPKDSKRYFIIPMEALKPDIFYAVTINKDKAKSTSGLSLEADYAWRFYTGLYPCNEPQFTLNTKKVECLTYLADPCGQVSEGACDEGFKDGEITATGNYTKEWATRYVTHVIDNCGHYTGTMDFTGDSGKDDFVWDGPEPGQSDPPGFTVTLDVPGAREWEGEEEYVWQRPGKFSCTATAHGACNKKKEIDYTYRCP